MNEKSRINYESMTPQDRAKNGAVREIITRQKIDKSKPSSTHKIKSLDDVLNERNRKSINQTHSGY